MQKILFPRGNTSFPARKRRFSLNSQSRKACGYRPKARGDRIEEGSVRLSAEKWKHLPQQSRKSERAM